jgi:hypothetical protein
MKVLTRDRVVEAVPATAGEADLILPRSGIWLGLID